MKLFARYNRINLLATVAIFLVASIVFYFFLRQVLISQVDEDLEIKQTEIETYISRYQRLPEGEQQPDQQIYFDKTAQPLKRNRFQTTASHRDGEEQRQLTFPISLPDGRYKVTINKSLEGTDHLTRNVAFIILSIILLILTISFLINRLVLRRLWQPFYDTLAAIQQFRLSSNEPLQLPHSDIDEFKMLHTALRQTTEMAGKEYELLKEFTENASHELQTPLAIIRSKLELMMQYDLDEPQTRTIQSANEALQGLVRLNRSLLLLTKIQNNQYAQKDTVAMQTLIKDKINAFEEIAFAKHISVQPKLENVAVSMNQDLAGLLVSNLLSNAIKHNKAGGKIDICLTNSNFIVENTGPAVSLDKNRLFTRFYNPAKTINSTGLGLSIVQQICQESGFEVAYQYIDGRHQFAIHF